MIWRLIVCALLCATFFGCSPSPEERFTEAVQTGDTDVVIELFDEVHTDAEYRKGPEEPMLTRAIDRLVYFSKHGDSRENAMMYEEVIELFAQRSELLTAMNSQQEIPLHYAARSNVEATVILVNAGADVNALDAEGRTPLDVVGEYNFFWYEGI